MATHVIRSGIKLEEPDLEELQEVFWDLKGPSTASQTDPYGKSAHEPGAKLDSGKLKADVVLGDFARALKAVCEIGTFGAKKYTEHGWITVPDGIQRYSDALMRHYLEGKRGELYDPESNLLHLAHQAWNTLAVLELYLRQQEIVHVNPTQPSPMEIYLKAQEEKKF